MQKHVTFVEKPLKSLIDKNHRKVRNHCRYTCKYRNAAHSICNWKLNIPNPIPVVFHSGSNYDYDFIIKQLEKEFERQFECLGKNKDKYRTFSVQLNKEITKMDKDGSESVVNISCKIKFIDSARFMASSLSTLVDDCAGRTYKIKYKDCHCFLKYESVKDSLMKYKCLFCNKIIQTNSMKN